MVNTHPIGICLGQSFSLILRKISIQKGECLYKLITMTNRSRFYPFCKFFEMDSFLTKSVRSIATEFQQLKAGLFHLAPIVGNQTVKI